MYHNLGIERSNAMKRDGTKNSLRLSQQREIKRKGVKETVLWFWKFTSLGGFTQCRDSDNSISKCAWFILALLGYGTTLYGVWFSIAGFLRHEYTTKMSYKTGTAFKTKINFPSVTICNKNRVHCGHLYDLIQNCTKVKYCYSL